MSYWDEKQYWGEAMTKNCIWQFQVKDCTVRGQDFFRTECIFATKQEAKDWGNSRTYEWGEEGKGWRVFGVPVYGIMAKCLSESKEFMELKKVNSDGK